MVADLQVRGTEEKEMQEKETLDERLPGLFEPDTLLPVQYFEAMRRKHLLEGEKRLVLSVLEDAVECFMKCLDATSNKGQRLFREAEEWINLEDKHWVFSFDNVCEMLDVNPEYMRKGLQRWKERRVAAKLAAIEAGETVAPAVQAVVQPETADGSAKAAAEENTGAPVVKQAKPITVVAAKPSRRSKRSRVVAPWRGTRLRKARA